MTIKPLKYRDMEKFLEKENLRKKTRKRISMRKYRRGAWTEYEDGLVMEHSITDTELSKLINRSVSSINGRRSYINKKLKGE